MLPSSTCYYQHSSAKQLRSSASLTRYKVIRKELLLSLSLHCYQMEWLGNLFFKCRMLALLSFILYCHKAFSPKSIMCLFCSSLFSYAVLSSKLLGKRSPPNRHLLTPTLRRWQITHCLLRQNYHTMVQWYLRHYSELHIPIPCKLNLPAKNPIDFILIL